jgi:dTDP-4-dehydrorhamnose 3,5-epimerase
MPFRFTPTFIPDVILIEPSRIADERGHFSETYKKSVFAEAGIPDLFLQDNESVSRKHVLRGIHYQLPPHAQGKLVRVVKGAVFDVAVDLREASPSFGRHVGIELSEENATMLWIPAGFGHAFQALTDNAWLQYKCTQEYHRQSEHGVIYSDPTLDIPWPTNQDVIVSEKDLALPSLDEAEVFA